MDGWTWTLFLLFATAVLGLLLGGFRTWRRYRGVRVITCPENHEPAAVRVAAVDAAKAQFIADDADIHLRSCSRWPEMAGCDEACLQEIHASPHDCLLQTIVASWYEGKVCHYCSKETGPIVWHERPPAVLLADGTIHEWKELPPERLPLVFAKGSPVCWPCFMVETFRQEHPESIVERIHLPEPHRALPPSSAVY